MTIRVLLADDQGLIRSGFAALIAMSDDIEVVGEAADGQRAVDLTAQLRPDVVLMDIRMPVMDGIAACRAITGNPGLSEVRVIVLTTFEADEYVLDALQNGASGFLGKNVEPDSLLQAIRVVAAGEALLSPRATRGLIARFVQPAVPDAPAAPPRVSVMDVLTDREREIVTWVARGHSNQDIAEMFFLSPYTVKTHINRAMAKLEARERAQLVVMAFRSGLVGVHELQGPPESP